MDNLEISNLKIPILSKGAPKCEDGTPIDKRSTHPGRPAGSLNLHSKHPSSIANRLKLAGLDWVVDLANAIKADNVTRINMWLKLLPYLIVTQGHRKIKRGKGKASKAAIQALEDLEGR